MKTRAVSIVLLMIVSALAGCTSGDPDGDGELGIDTDVLNQMIEDNLQDFINNSSVTVHQTIHYHNNTTFVDNSESNMNVGGSSGNGSSTTGIIHTMRIQQDITRDVIDTGDIQLIQNGILQFPTIDFAPTMSYNLDGMIISMDFTCEEFISAGHFIDYNDWYDWAREDLGLSHSGSESLASNIQGDIYELWNEAEEYCNWNNNYNYYEEFAEEMFRIDIPEGQALSLIQFSNYAYSEFNWTLVCDDGYTIGGSIYSTQQYLGGWTDCQLIGYHSWNVNGYWQHGYISQNSQGNSSTNNNSDQGNPSVPDWYNDNRWYSWVGGDGSSSVDWILYYTVTFVVPVE